MPSNESTEQSVQNSIEESGGIPRVTMSVSVSGMTQYPVDKTLSIEDMGADAKATGDAINDLQAAVTDVAGDVSAIKGWTAADLPMTGETGADSVSDAIGSLNTAVGAIEAWTGEDIPLTDALGAPKISEAISAISNYAYPVGSIYMTVSTEAPTFGGTWVEVAITASWTQLKEGKRGYAALEENDTGGSVHFWLRTA